MESSEPSTEDAVYARSGEHHSPVFWSPQFETEMGYLSYKFAGQANFAYLGVERAWLFAPRRCFLWFKLVAHARGDKTLSGFPFVSVEAYATRLIMQKFHCSQ